MILIFKEDFNIGKLNQIDLTLLDIARKLNSIKKRYNIYRLGLVDKFDKVYIFLSDINKFNYNIYLNEISFILQKELKDNELYLKKINENEWEIISDKLNLLIDNDREKIALKMDDCIVILNNKSSFYFGELKELDQKIYKDDREYILYQSSKPEEIQQILCNYLNNNLEKYVIEDYLINIRLI